MNARIILLSICFSFVVSCISVNDSNNHSSTDTDFLYASGKRKPENILVGKTRNIFIEDETPYKNYRMKITDSNFRTVLEFQIEEKDDKRKEIILFSKEGKFLYRVSYKFINNEIAFAIKNCEGDLALIDVVWSMGKEYTYSISSQGQFFTWPTKINGILKYNRQNSVLENIITWDFENVVFSTSYISKRESYESEYYVREGFLLNYPAEAGLYCYILYCINSIFPAPFEQIAEILESEIQRDLIEKNKKSIFDNNKFKRPSFNYDGTPDHNNNPADSF